MRTEQAADGRLAIDSDFDVKRRIGLRVNVLARMMRNHFDRQVANLNVTRSQWAMIAVVARQPGLTQRMISEALEMSEASAGRLIDRLCADGLLERREREDDRRARSVYLTKASQPLLDKLAEIAATGEVKAFKGFSDDDLDRFIGYLDHLYANLSHN